MGRSRVIAYSFSSPFAGGARACGAEIGRLAIGGDCIASMAWASLVEAEAEAEAKQCADKPCLRVIPLFDLHRDARLKQMSQTAFLQFHILNPSLSRIL